MLCTFYCVLYCSHRRTPDAASGTARDITAPANSFNLDTLNVAVDNTYLITLVAVNRRGNSDESNQVMYEPTQQTECKSFG